MLVSVSCNMVQSFLFSSTFWAEKPIDTPLVDETFTVDSLGGGFKYFLFSPLFGEDSYFD